MTHGQYELIDFGGGRKLESLAGYLIDRPSPAADSLSRASVQPWDRVDASFDAETKRWRFHNSWPDSLAIDCGSFQMPVQPTPYGHIGLFPEQAANWDWLFERAQRLVQRWGRCADEPVWGLNLFGYTGASTMAMASAGLAVSHVDAARPNVQACRRAAASNALGDATIRFLVDDAAKFAAREVRRGRRYRVVVMDPPAYGHAPGGKAWRLDRDLWPLLEQCLQLLEDEFAMLITGHSPQVDQGDVADFLCRHQKLQARWQASGLNLASGRSQLKDSRGRSLDAGFWVRLWSRPSRLA